MILNLTELQNSEISYEKFCFPDGQQNIIIKSLINPNFNVQIISRLSSFTDLELIVCATASLRAMGINEISLTVPYFIGGRSDRKFIVGGNNYLRDVICPIINAQNYTSIEVLDPHSDVIEACIKNIKISNNFKLVKNALTMIDNKNGAQERIVLVSPDAGAYKKISNISIEFGINNIITASKIRDIRTGKILKTEISNLPENASNELKYVIIDDICDGGKTFIEIAKEIKSQQPLADIYLIVTHGIFSKGFEELDLYFTKIFTTNSIDDIVYSDYLDKDNKRGYFNTHTTTKAKDNFIDQIDIF